MTVCSELCDLVYFETAAPMTATKSATAHSELPFSTQTSRDSNVTEAANQSADELGQGGSYREFVITWWINVRHQIKSDIKQKLTARRSESEM